MKDHVYLVLIKMSDNMTFKAFVSGPEDIEVDLLDFYYQKYSNDEPDISKYTVKNITKDFETKLSFDFKKAVQFSAAIDAKEYSEMYS